MKSNLPKPQAGTTVYLATDASGTERWLPTLGSAKAWQATTTSVLVVTQYTFAVSVRKRELCALLAGTALIDTYKFTPSEVRRGRRVTRRSTP